LSGGEVGRWRRIQNAKLKTEDMGPLHSWHVWGSTVNKDVRNQRLRARVSDTTVATRNWENTLVGNEKWGPPTSTLSKRPGANALETWRGKKESR